jgi:hypothetical protein
MSDPSTTDDAQQAQTPEQLREYAKRREAAAEEARAEADALREKNRSLALQVAGVDVESPVGKLFVKANPELTEVDDIKAAWAEVAPQGTAAPAAETTPVDDGPTPEERAAAAARGALSTGGTPPGEEPTGPVWPNALEGFRQDRAKGVRVEAAQRNALQSVMDAAVAGDPSAIFDEQAWKAQFQR